MLGLKGKTAVVFGVASEDSIAWAICQQLAEAGADLFLGYQKRFMSRVFQLKDKLPAIKGFYPLDVAQDDTTREFFDEFAKNILDETSTYWFMLLDLHHGVVSIDQFSSLKMQISIRR